MVCLVRGKQRALGVVLIWLDGPQNKNRTKPNKNQPKATQMLGIIKQEVENKAQKTKHY